MIGKENMQGNLGRLEYGQRRPARTETYPDLPRAMETEEFVGKEGLVRPGGEAPNLMRF